MIETEQLLCALENLTKLLKANLAINTNLVGPINTETEKPMIVQGSYGISLDHNDVKFDVPPGATAALVQLKEGSMLYRLDGAVISDGQGYSYNKVGGFITFNNQLELIHLVGSPTAKIFVTFYQ